MKKYKIGGQFSGVGAFDQALKRLGIDYENIYQAEWDKYARQTYLHNYEEPIYYVKDVHDTPTEEITEKYGSLDLAMFSPPCQAFSLAGKRKGKDDMRGILFFNSLEFIRINKPRYFIFENVKGLLSDDNGKTFSEWVNLLGGKSVNGAPVIFPYDDSVPYHLYWQVLNAKHHGVPQNRERVFLVGIRDDKDNTFRFPPEEHLTKRLKDVLDEEVDEKYYLSSKTIDKLTNHSNPIIDNDNPDKSATIHAGYFKMGGRDQQYLKVGTNLNDEVDSEHNVVRVQSATSKGYEEATEGDSINLSVPNSKTRRGRVGKGVAQTLDTACNQSVVINAGQETWGGNAIIIDNTNDFNEDKPRIYTEYAPSIRSMRNGLQTISNNAIVDYGNDRLNQTLKKHNLPDGEIKIIDSYNQTVHDHSVTISTRVNASCQTHLWNGYRIRRLTPRECFRLMDFDESFTWICSDSQAYKQAGNSIVVNVLYKIIKNLNL